jgi:hypothetical protein
MESLTFLTKTFLALFLSLCILYLVFRLGSKAIFKSYFESKTDINKSEEKKGEN